MLQRTVRRNKGEKMSNFKYKREITLTLESDDKLKLDDECNYIVGYVQKLSNDNKEDKSKYIATSTILKRMMN